MNEVKGLFGDIKSNTDGSITTYDELLDIGGTGKNMKYDIKHLKNDLIN